MNNNKIITIHISVLLKRGKNMFRKVLIITIVALVVLSTAVLQLPRRPQQRLNQNRQRLRRADKTTRADTGPCGADEANGAYSGS